MIRIDIKDDGVGLAASGKTVKDFKRGGLGLFSIRERLEQFGATMDVVSPSTGGTCVTLMARLGDPSQRKELQ